jgi:hypothetical protein
MLRNAASACRIFCEASGLDDAYVAPIAVMLSPNLHPVRSILERLAYVCYLAVLVSSIGVTWLGWVVGVETGNYTAMCLALAGLGLSRWLHVQGYAHWHFQECEDSFDVQGEPGVMPQSEPEAIRAKEMAALLARMETEPDVWERGALRREIATRLAAAPALREEFAETLAAHPDL